MSAFFTLHRDLPREGPGDRESLDWALTLAAPPADGAILDAACGPGADIAGLLAHVPDGRLVAIDTHPEFVAAARARHAGDPRVTVIACDMVRPDDRFDLIWCAGALYFLGVARGLSGWRTALSAQGAVAFSEPVWRVRRPSAQAIANWEEYPEMTDADGVGAQVRAAGYRALGSRLLSNAAWDGYYHPMEARIADLRPGADADLTAVLDEAETEIAAWRACGHEFGYLLTVARPA